MGKKKICKKKDPGAGIMSQPGMVRTTVHPYKNSNPKIYEHFPELGAMLCALEVSQGIIIAKRLQKAIDDDEDDSVVLLSY